MMEKRWKEEVTASVMDLERFAIHDGPGIRTVVFLQGCPLHCIWCANPESQVIGAQLMYGESRCVGCGVCAGNCPASAIAFREGRPQFCRERCIHCRCCEKGCLQGAIGFSGKSMTVEEIMEEVLRDQDYYENSGGGVTFSGGDPFVQFPALSELLKRCREQGLHTAVETCGQTSFSNIRQAEPMVDLFLFDLKHVDAEKLKAYTGGELHLIMKNLEYLAGVGGKKVILRVPVIPGFNHDAETMYGIVQVACRYGIETMHLLPYHTLGIDKYKRLGREYQLPRRTLLKKDELNQYRAIGEESGLTVQIGG